MALNIRDALARSLACLPALVIGGCIAYACAAADQAKPMRADPAKPMAMHEPMAGEMKKDGMMKEDVSKAARKWDQKMDQMMKKENKK